jgi:hypothetical protein
MSEGAGASGHAGLEEAFDELDAEVLAAMADTRAALMAEPSNAAGFRQVLAHARQICARQTQLAGFQEARTMNEIAGGIEALSEIFEEVCRSVDHAMQ